jgi:hypothetical protein
MCPLGFSGSRCEVDRDECAINPCLNGGQCIDRQNDFECRCPPGFVGALCQDDIDECLARPCANGATCRQLVNDFRCTCAPGFAGRYCTENIDECASSPCRNGGTCVDGIAGFDCRCTHDFVGIVCETPVASLDGVLQQGVEWRPVAERPHGGFQSQLDTASSPARSKSERMSNQDVGAATALNAVQPLLLVASFGLALPIVFVACAFAIWIHRRRASARLRLREGRHPVVGACASPPEADLNNRRRVSPVSRSMGVAAVDAGCMQQQQQQQMMMNDSRMSCMLTAAPTDVVIVDSYVGDKSLKNNSCAVSQGQGQGQNRWSTTSDRRLDNMLQYRNNISTSPDQSAINNYSGNGITSTGSSALWTTAR